MMINNIFINIVRMVFTGQIFDEIDKTNDELVINKLIDLSELQSLEVILFYGLEKLNVNIPLEFANKVKTLIYKSATQDAELETIKKVFNDNEVKFLPLKGSIIRKIYPSIDMRSMADIDILVEKSKFKLVKRLMLKNNYKLEHSGGNHDSYFKLPFMNVEIHRNMIDESYELSKYYKNIWSKAILNDKYEYQLKREDYYIFMIAHAEKHFANSGCGIRVLIDIYLFLKEYGEQLDKKYIDDELRKINLYSFNKKIVNVSSEIFSGELSNENKTIVDYMLSSGIYGNIENSSIINGFLNSDDIDSMKSKYIIRRIFPPYKIMVKRNPLIKKIPILLLWFWFVRILKGAFRYKKYRNEIKTINQIDEEKINYIKKINEEIGVNKKSHE